MGNDEAEIPHELLPDPCPCCAGYAKLERVMIKPCAKYVVYCTVCKLSTWPYLTAEKAVSKWNSRVGIKKQ